MRHLPPLQAVIAQLAARVIRATGQRRLTIDVDGTAVSTGQQVRWAQRGYNPHHRKVPSCYPITAYEAQSGQVLRVQNRPGNVGDGKAGVVVTNKPVSGAALWAFMWGRGMHEKVYGELKSGLAFNLSRSFQLATTARRRAGNRKRRALFALETIHTLRALGFQRAGILVHPQGAATLDVGHVPGVVERFKRLDRLLAA